METTSHIDGALALLQVAADPSKVKTALEDMQKKIDRLAELEAQAPEWVQRQKDVTEAQHELREAQLKLRADREAFVQESQRFALSMTTAQREREEREGVIVGKWRALAEQEDALKGNETQLERDRAALIAREKVIATRERAFEVRAAAHRELGSI